MYNVKVALLTSEIGQKIKQHTQEVYKAVYDANINPNPDEFIYLENGDEIYASFGITYRENRKLFSECYLDIPLEKQEYAFGHLVSCEVGSCISVKSGFGLQLYKLLPYILREKHISYILVTLTSKVKTLFDRLHFDTIYLTDAAENRVPVRNIWGSFYETLPKTFIMNVQKSCSDISLTDYAKKLNIQINELGRIIEQEKGPGFCNLDFYKSVNDIYHKGTYQKLQNNLLNLKINNERP